MKVIGCDVSKDFIVLYDGKRFYLYAENEKTLKKKRLKRLPPGTETVNLKRLKELVNGSTVILEQTGTYGVRYAKILEELGANILIADGKEFKRFRHGRHRNKNDLVDAKYLREMFFSPYHQRYIRPFHYGRYRLRALIRHQIRTNKDLTRAVNRLKQLLAYLFPGKDYYTMNRYSLFKNLEAIKKELLSHPDSLSLSALSEIKKIEVCLEAIEIAEKEIESIIVNHQDYKILKSFPHLGIKAIASLIAYYWDISLFSSKDAFIGYVLMGTRLEQSGSSLFVNKTDKSRSEVKAIFYMIFQQAHRRNSPYKPLVNYIATNYYGKHNNKKRFIKFLDKLLELVYYALKYRLTFDQVIKTAIFNKALQIKALQEKEKSDELTREELVRLYRTNGLKLAYEDISSRLEECQTYCQEKEPLPVEADPPPLPVNPHPEVNNEKDNENGISENSSRRPGKRTRNQNDSCGTESNPGLNPETDSSGNKNIRGSGIQGIRDIQED